MKNLKTCRVNVMISNMDKAIEFYQNKLELELINHYGEKDFSFKVRHKAYANR